LDATITGKDHTMPLIRGTPNNDFIVGTNFADLIYTYSGNDTVYAKDGNDTVYGGSGNDWLYGQNGNDVLYGNADFDYLSGGTGNDTLVGGGGPDGLSGGFGTDYFRMNTASEANGDRIYDFRQAEGDKIDLHNIDAVENKWWSPGTWGNQAFSFIHTNNFTGTPGQVRYFHSGGNTYVQGSTDSDKAAEFTITLSGTVTLKYWDFWH
jgi:Ca2+-binding RTX toxin-like protein